MTAAELEIYRLKLRVELRDYALGYFIDLMKALHAETAIQDWAQLVRTSIGHMTVPHLDAATSDLASAELEEAVDELIDSFKLGQ